MTAVKSFIFTYPYLHRFRATAAWCVTACTHYLFLAFGSWDTLNLEGDFKKFFFLHECSVCLTWPRVSALNLVSYRPVIKSGLLRWFFFNPKWKLFFFFLQRDVSSYWTPSPPWFFSVNLVINLCTPPHLHLQHVQFCSCRWDLQTALKHKDKEKLEEFSKLGLSGLRASKNNFISHQL